MALPTYKDIVDLIKKGATVEAQEQIMALREGALALQEENISLRQRVSELEAALSLRAEVHFDSGVYWRQQAEKRDGPFCQRCYDVESKLIRLQSHHYPHRSRNNYQWECRACSKAYDDLTK